MAITTISALTRAVEGRSDDLFLISRPETNVTNRYYRSFSMGLSAIKNYCVTDMEYLPLSGGTMTGPIVLQTGVSLLDDNPTPKSYVDSADQNLQNKIDALSNKVKSKYLPFSGGTMTGKITLDGNPKADNHATNKKYVDDINTDLQKKISALPKGLTAEYLPLSGGTMTGKITLDGNPKADNHATNKKYVDDISVDLQKKIDGKGIDLTGKAGDVAYTAPNGLVKQQIGQKLLVCETAAEVERCKENAPTMEKIFKQWTKFGTIHVRNGKGYDGKDLEYFQDGENSPEVYDTGYMEAGLSESCPIGVREWKYIDGKIIQEKNTSDFTGYVSNKKFLDYTMEFRFSSTDNDDDFNGVIAAYALDNENRLHTLSFIRSPNNSNKEEMGKTVDSRQFHWYCALDLREPFAPGLTAYLGKTINQKLIKNSALTGIPPATESGGGWSNYKNYGVKVKVTRTGNVFKAETTGFSNTGSTYLDAHTLTVDLEQLYHSWEGDETYRNILKLFIDQPVRIGVCTNSQPYSTFDIIDFPVQTDRVVDLVEGKVWEYTVTGWNEASTTPVLCMGPGRIAYNTITKKLFYNDGTTIYRMGIAVDVDTDGITDNEDHVPCSKLVNGLKSLISEQVERLRSIV